jgi:hypothetical protein
MDALRLEGVQCKAFVGENSSRDGTRELILSYAKWFVELVDTTAIANVPRRLERMARAREMVKKKLSESQKRFQYVCVVDTDDVLEKPISAESIISAINLLETRSELFAVSAVSAPWYYDLLAYRSDEYDFSDLNDQLAVSKTKPLDYYGFHRKVIYPAQRKITSLQTHLVSSAFNGISVYRYDDYVRGAYVQGNSFTVCEHVIFHASLNRDSKRGMLVSQKLRTEMPRGHGPANLWTFLFQRLMRKIG